MLPSTTHKEDHSSHLLPTPVCGGQTYMSTSLSVIYVFSPVAHAILGQCLEQNRISSPRPAHQSLPCLRTKLRLTASFLSWLRASLAAADSLQTLLGTTATLALLRDLWPAWLKSSPGWLQPWFSIPPILSSHICHRRQITPCLSCSQHPAALGD